MEDDEAGKKWLRKYLDEHEVTWPQITSGAAWGGGISTPYEIHGLPLNLLFDREGKLVAVDIRGKKLDDAIARILDVSSR